MNEYLQKATDFLNKAGATCQIVYGGIARNENWKEEEKRNWYDVIITSSKGSMTFVFWDSIHNTKISQMSLEQYCAKKLKRTLKDCCYSEGVKLTKELKKKKEEAIPNAYNVLAHLVKYDPGSFEDFCQEYGYDEDSRTAERTYFAVQKEYHELLKVFTEEQMEELREIN